MKKEKITFIIISSITFIIGYYISYNVFNLLVNGLYLHIICILVSTALFHNMYRYLLEKVKKQNDKDNMQILKIQMNIKYCEFCLKEITKKRNNEEIENINSESDFILRDIHYCDNCKYEVSETTLYKVSERKHYNYIEIIDYGNIDKRKLEKGNLILNLNLLQAIYKSKEKKHNE